MPETSWLDLEAPADSAGALVIPDGARISGRSKLSKEQTRFPSMAKRLLGKSRTWACDGEFVAFRRKQANPATLERHERFLRIGDYVHVATHDDVEIYQLRSSSPFARQPLNFGEMNFANVRRQAALAACRRDWATYVDALSEMAGRLKGKFHTAYAEMIYNDHVTWILHIIRMRGGPSEQEINQGLIAVRQRRGEHRNRVLMLPARRVVD